MNGRAEGGERRRPGGETLRELTRSLASFGWAMGLLGVRGAGRLLGLVGGGGEAAAAELDAVTAAVRDELGRGGCASCGEGRPAAAGGGAGAGAPAAGGAPAAAAADRPVAPTAPAAGVPVPRPAPPPAPRVPADPGRLDPSTFVVLGEGLAAGMAGFALRADDQRASFPAVMAERMGVALEQPLFEPPGLGDAPGVPRLPVRLPAALQGTVLAGFPPARPFAHLAVPGLTLAEALELRPEPPLVHRDDARRTTLNFVLGLPWLAGGEAAGRPPTAVEAAVARGPSLVLVELGFAEALAAAAAGDLARLPAAAAFGERYGELVARLRETGAEVLATTVPDPLDTAYFSTVGEAAELLRVAPADLVELWGVGAEDRLALPALDAVAFQIAAGRRAALPAGGVLPGAAARGLAARVREINQALTAAAARGGAQVFDLWALVRGLAEHGLEAGGRRLTARHLGGLYSLSGAFPGATAQAAIAHELLAFLNDRYGARFPGVDLAAVATADPAAACRPAGGPLWPRRALPAAGEAPPPAAPTPPARRAGDGRASGELVASKEAPPGPLRLPPGRVQTLPLARRASYFGDGIRPIHARRPEEAAWGSSGELLFGGLAMVDSHLAGEITLRFSEPVDGMTRFEIDFGAGFAGDDAVLAAPQGFRMPFLRSRVDPVPGTVSAGSLDLRTGMVTELTVYAAYQSTALGLLVGVNPHFPRQPLSFPGQYGSAWARFEQREDGLLDFSFYGSTFVPLGPGTMWPLNYAGADGLPAVIPASGTAMHPHLALSTREPEAPWADPPDLPENTLREYTLFTHNSSFGDKFDLDTPELGGEATGRSHLLGRLEVQFGERTAAGTQPFAVTSLAPGGLLSDLPPSPLTAAFPGRLSPGPLGFNEFLRFPLRSYYLDSVYILDDPFDISVGLIDGRTGWAVGEVLHRGFIGQDLIFALLRVEPRTPRDSFFFRGPALFERTAAGGTAFRFKGEVFVPYPAGFLFPQPDLTTGFVVRAPSKLDPFFWLHALDGGAAAGGKSGGAENVIASNGDRFSYRYRIPAEPAREPAAFEYVNHSQEGRFRLERLTWLELADVGGGERRQADTVTFGGFGVWSKDGIDSVEQVSVQVSTAPGAAYVGIQVAAGAVSNVNTKPPDVRDALP